MQHSRYSPPRSVCSDKNKRTCAFHVLQTMSSHWFPVPTLSAGALVKTDEQEVINFLLTTEIIPLCLRIMESGSELSKTVLWHDCVSNRYLQWYDFQRVENNQHFILQYNITFMWIDEKPSH